MSVVLLSLSLTGASCLGSAALRLFIHYAGMSSAGSKETNNKNYHLDNNQLKVSYFFRSHANQSYSQLEHFLMAYTSAGSLLHLVMSDNVRDALHHKPVCFLKF